MFRSKKILLVLPMIVLLLFSLISFSACGEKSAIEEKKLTEIASIFPLTGKIAMIGEWHKNGSDYYQLNSKDLVIRYVDSEGTPNKAISGLNLIKDKIDGVVGTLSSVMISVIKSVQTEKPIFLVNVSSPNVTLLGDNVYRYNIDVIDEVKILFKEMKANNVTEIGVLYINDEYGLSAINFLKENSNEINIEVKFSESYEPSQMDFKDITSMLAEYNFPLVVLGYGRSYISLIKSIAEVKYKNVIYTDYSMFVKEFKKPLLGCGLEVYYIGPSIDKEIFEKWSEKYISQNQKEPNYAVCISYDIVNIMHQVLQNEKNLNKIKLKKYLEENEIYSVYGFRIISDEEGEIKVPLQIIHETL